MVVLCLCHLPGYSQAAMSSPPLEDLSEELGKTQPVNNEARDTVCKFKHKSKKSVWAQPFYLTVSTLHLEFHKPLFSSLVAMHNKGRVSRL